MSRFRILAVMFSLALLVALPVSQAQQAKPPAQEPKKEDKRKDKREDAKAIEQQPAKGDEVEAVKIETNIVQLDVFVTDSSSVPVNNLVKENFVVYEDKVKQEIESVERTEVPLSFGLVVDTSGSMRSKLQTVTDAGLSLIRTMQKDDEGFVAQFKAEPELVQDFTRDRRELEDAMGELFTSGGTALLDAIIATADYAQEKAKNRRRAIIVITDGVEKNSAVKEKEVLEAIKEDEVQIYLVGFVDEEDTSAASLFGKSGARKAKELLQRIADDSGGRAFFPKDISEMAEIAKQIAKDLRTQYVVSYYPNNPNNDGKFRTVKVEATTKDNRKLVARTRQGYYAKKDK